MNKIPYIKLLAVIIGFVLIVAGTNDILVGLGLGIHMAILLNLLKDLK